MRRDSALDSRFIRCYWWNFVLVSFPPLSDTLRFNRLSHPSDDGFIERRRWRAELADAVLEHSSFSISTPPRAKWVVFANINLEVFFFSSFMIQSWHSTQKRYSFILKFTNDMAQEQIIVEANVMWYECKQGYIHIKNEMKIMRISKIYSDWPLTWL